MRQRGGVVDPVANHRHLLAGALQLGDLAGLVGGEDPGHHLTDAELAGDAFGGGAVVPCQHHDIHALPLECLNRSFRARAGSVADADHGRCASVDRHHDHGSPLRRHVVAPACQSVEADLLEVHQPRVPDGHAAAVDGGHGAMPGHVLKVSHFALSCARLHGAADDGFGQRVLRVSFDRCGKRQHLFLRHSVGVNLSDFRLALGQRPRLVHHDDLDSSGGLDSGRVLEQDPAPGAEAGAHHDRGRGRQPESVRAGDDDHRDREEDGLAESTACEQPDDQGQRATEQRHQHQPEGRAICELLSRRLRALGFLNQLDDLGQRRVRAHLRRPGAKGAVLVDGTADQLKARRLRNREALAGHDRLVHLAGPVLDHRVYGDPGARPDQKKVADPDVRRRDFDLLAILDDDRFGRGKTQEGADRIISAAPGSHLEPVAQEHEGGQYGRCFVEDVPTTAERDDDRVDPARRDCNRDQNIHVQRAGS